MKKVTKEPSKQKVKVTRQAKSRQIKSKVTKEPSKPEVKVTRQALQSYMNDGLTMDQIARKFKCSWSDVKKQIAIWRVTAVGDTKTKFRKVPDYRNTKPNFADFAKLVKDKCSKCDIGYAYGFESVQQVRDLMKQFHEVDGWGEVEDMFYLNAIQELVNHKQELYSSWVRADELLCDMFQEVLNDRVEKVVVSTTLVDSPCCLVTTGAGALRDCKTLEICSKNSIMKKLKKRAVADRNNQCVKDMAVLLFETAMVTAGVTLDDPNTFGKRIHKIVDHVLTEDDDAETDSEE